MLVLGLAGGLDPIDRQILDTPEAYTYDGAAVLVEDGNVVAAFEEARLNRIKHSNKFPAAAIRHCLAMRGVALPQIDRIAYYVDEVSADALLARMYLDRPDIAARVNARQLLVATLARECGDAIDPGRLCFFEHKLTHAACTMHQSGFDESLVYVIDNAGGLYRGARDASGKVALDTIALTQPSQSLQKLCHALLPFLGLGLFEEYRALALAQFGNPERFEAAVGTLYELLPDGRYRLDLASASDLRALIDPPRGGVLTKAHHDLAAALQQAMERIVLHVLAHHRAATGLHKLCTAGGMADNIATSTAIRSAGLFDEIFVHPAAYDAGCALGAALLASQAAGTPPPRARIADVRWGSDIGDAAAELREWTPVVSTRAQIDPPRRAAECLARGATIGWVQGRSDFGTHALGTRNAFAAAAPIANRERLHRALGRAEVHRPLAAMIRAEDLARWCEGESDPGALGFQTFLVRARAEARAALAAALTHDGRFCVQTVARDSQPLLWQLLTHLDALTGSPVLLSASLNRSDEPTAESIADAVVSFLGSQLDYLIVADCLVERREIDWEARGALHLALPPHVELVRSQRPIGRHPHGLTAELRTTTTAPIRRAVTPLLGDLLATIGEAKPLGRIVSEARLDADDARQVIDEIDALWSAGMVLLRPARAKEAA